MTTARVETAKQAHVRFPDIPERTPDDMTSAKAIHLNGKSHYLDRYFADRPNTLVDAEHYISRIPNRDMTGVVYPDLLVSFNANLQALEQSNAYVISEQGKPPDFILEIASRRTRRTDKTIKRDIYAGLEVPEYWRFDEKPTRTNPGLAGDRLVEGRYEPVSIEVLPDGRLRGYSAVLNLILEWHDGQLNWIDPATGEHIPTFDQERDARLRAETQAQQERNARLSTEARNRELEAEISRLKGE